MWVTERERAGPLWEGTPPVGVLAEMHEWQMGQGVHAWPHSGKLQMQGLRELIDAPLLLTFEISRCHALSTYSGINGSKFDFPRQPSQNQKPFLRQSFL